MTYWDCCISFWPHMMLLRFTENSKSFFPGSHGITLWSLREHHTLLQFDVDREPARPVFLFILTPSANQTYSYTFLLSCHELPSCWLFTALVWRLCIFIQTRTNKRYPWVCWCKFKEDCKPLKMIQFEVLTGIQKNLAALLASQQAPQLL